MSLPDVRTAVLPVAGLGTRFLPITKAVPKEMLPLVDRPCIEYVVAEAVEAGIERIVMVTAAGKDALTHYFRRDLALEQVLESAGKQALLADVKRVCAMAEIVTVRQDEALGLGHAVLQARPAVGEAPFAVLLGDDVIVGEQPAIGQLLQARQDDPDGCDTVVALMEVPRAQTNRYGVCAGPMHDARRMRVDAMVEKPDPADAPSNFAIVGRYVLPADIWDILADTPPGAGREIQLTDALAVLAQSGRVCGWVFDGDRYDTGNVLGLLRASLHLALARPDLTDGVRAIVEELRER